MAATTIDRHAENWFRNAERDYLEMHQGCSWCGGSHLVFRQHRGSTLLFHCQGCDFHASHDEATDRFAFIPGEAVEPVLDTMCEEGPIAVAGQV